MSTHGNTTKRPFLSRNRTFRGRAPLLKCLQEPYEHYSSQVTDPKKQFKQSRQAQQAC